MKNKKILLILAIIFLISIIIFLSKNNFGKFSNNNFDNKKPLKTNSQTFLVEQKIVFNDGRPDESHRFDVKQGESVLDLLARTKNIRVKEYSFGKMVMAIDNLENGKDKKYWIYFINDQEAKIGASNYKLKAGERITWKFKAYEQ